MKTCKHCGKTQPKSYEFCYNCGGTSWIGLDTEPTKLIKCYNCKRENPIFVKFCPKCGTKAELLVPV